MLGHEGWGSSLSKALERQGRKGNSEKPKQISSAGA